MLNFFQRRASMVRIVFGFLLALVSISMVITLIPGLTGVTTDPNAIEVVAQVGGEKITTFDVQQGISQLSRVNQIPSEMTWLYTQQVLDQMILEKVTAQEAERMGLEVSPAEMLNRLRQIPDLFPQGTFVGQQQYEDMVQQRFGVSVAEFEHHFRNGLLTEKLRQVITDSVAVTPEEIRETFLSDNEKLVLSYMFFDPANYKKQIAPNDAALEDYFKKHTDAYRIPERRSVKVLLLETEKVRQGTTVPEADQRKYYQSHVDDYRQTERVSVSHILLRVQGKDPAKLEQAKKKAEDLLKQLKGGADFADLAKKNSEDPGSAVKGGDLGWITRGQTVPEFEKAVFSLAPGSLSDPVQTEYGIHILKVAAHEQAKLRPFEEVQKEIAKNLSEEKVQATMTATAEEAAAEWRRAPENLEALANRVHGTVLSPPPVAKGDAIPGLAGSQAISEDVFVLEKNQVGRPVSVPSGYAIPLLLDILPTHPAEFAEVKEQVRTDYVDEQARAKANSQAQVLTQLLEKQEKKDLAKAAKTLGLTAKTSEPLTRAGALPSVGNVKDLGPRLATLQPGDVAGPLVIGGGQIVYQLDSRQPPKEEELAAQREAIRQRLLSVRQSLAFSIFQEDLKNRLTKSGDLKINDAVLARLTAPAR